jgi:hypothetical protein
MIILMNRKHKGTIIMEAIISAVIVLLSFATIAYMAVITRPLISYQIDRIVVYNLAKKKMMDIANKIDSGVINTSNVDYTKYYGFQYTCGSDQDIQIGDNTKQNNGQYMKGVFAYEGHPEVRYQYYFVHNPSDSNIIGVVLEVWKYASWRTTTNTNTMVKVVYEYNTIGK